MDARRQLCISIGGTEEVCEEEMGCTGGSPCKRVTDCQAFFIGSDGSGSECCSASSISGDESDAESCHGVVHQNQSIASLEACRFRFPSYHQKAIKDGLNMSTTISTECPSAVKNQTVESAQLEHSQIEGADIHELLTRLRVQHEDEMLSVRQELKSLTDAVECERRERMTAFQYFESTSERLTCALDKERSERLHEFSRLSREGNRSSMASLEATRTCLASISDLSCTLEKESRDRIALEVSVCEAFQIMQGEFEQEVAERAHLVKHMKHMKEKRCEDQDQLALRLKEIRKAVEQESRDRIHGFEHMRGYIDGACQRIDGEVATLSQALKIEEKQREDAGEDIRQQFVEIRIQFDEILAEFCTKLSEASQPLGGYTYSPILRSPRSSCTSRISSPPPWSPSSACSMHPEANVEL